jgi:prohibitin 2
MDAEKVGKDFMNKFAKGGAPKGSMLGASLIAGSLAAGYAIWNSMFSIEAGHRAIMFNRIGGIANDVYREGLHFRIPW